MLKLPAVFSDHMVLQRNKRISVWGHSDGKKVSIRLIDDKNTELCREITEVDDGEWFTYLSPLNAGGPYLMEIKSGQDVVCYEDVMIGEVWLAGGQSNMEFELHNCRDGESLVENAKDEGVRFYYTPKVSWVGEELLREEANCSWELCKPETCGRWSAVGYFFGKKLAEKLGVTVGILGCNWGGTSASCWMSREALESRKSLSSYLDEYDFVVATRTEEEYLEQYKEYKRRQGIFDEKVGEYYKNSSNPTWEEAVSLYGPNLYPGPMGSRSERRPNGLYESMLKRVMPYSLKGFIYYQAEEDDHKPYIYGELFEALIECWRRDWRDESLPFIFVQLPMFSDFGAEDFKNWPFLREAQAKVFNTVKNTGMAVALDMGEFGNIHPIDKKPVGDRLANQALYQVYSQASEEEAFGPIYKDYMIDNDKVYIQLEHVFDGLSCENGEITGFEIAGKDRVYYPATAMLLADEETNNAFTAQLVISCDKVKKPVYARYCWTNYSEVTLFGGNGIPVAPFRIRTDDGAIATGNRQGIIME